MNTGKTGAVGSAGPSAPSKGAGELASVLLEIKQMSPEHLDRIGQSIKDFHTWREEFEKSQRDAELAQETELVFV